jgi:hypothetical protein
MLRYLPALCALLMLAASCGDSSTPTPTPDATATPTPALRELTATEAEGAAITWLTYSGHAIGSKDWLNRGFHPFCAAKERAPKGWDVQCGWDRPPVNAQPEQRVEQWITVVVGDDGSITSP